MASSIVTIGPIDINKNPNGTRKLTTIDHIGGIFCNICQSTFSNKKDYDRHYIHHNLGTNNIAYTCIVCRKNISGYPSFRNHCYQTHVQKEKFRCEFCSKTFSKQCVLTSHIEAVHKFQCTSCKEEFQNKRDLTTHQFIHKNVKDKLPYSCFECKEEINTLDVCELHVDEHCSFLYPCPICNETSSTKIEATMHLTNHFNEELDENLLTETPQMNEDSSIDILGGIYCCYCNERYKNRLEFETHFVTEHGDRELVFSCNICGKQFDKYFLFGNHCYFHISKGRFECSDCGKTFPRLSLLVVHTEAFHSSGADGRPFKCGRCSRSFRGEAPYRHHLRTVHAVNYMECPESGCWQTFESTKDLVLHQTSHKSSTDNQRCQQCGLQLSTLSACESHLEVHRKKHYPCPVCGRQYREKYLLMKHIIPHFESVLHICNTCGKAFHAKNRLVEHSKVHSEVRNHICSICGKGFVKPYQLEQHLNIHTGNKPFKCSECPKVFASYPNFLKHMRRMHSVGPKQIKQALKNEPEKIDSKATIESGIDSTSEISVEMYSLAESDDSTIDSVGPVAVETDLIWASLNENSLVNSNIEYTDLTPVTDLFFDSAMLQDPTITGTQPAPEGYPREYGPDFGQRGVDPDDHYLPHIDPLLTIKNQETPVYGNEYADPNIVDWPCISKVSYEDTDYNMMPIINTNIF